MEESGEKKVSSFESLDVEILWGESFEDFGDSDSRNRTDEDNGLLGVRL